MLKYLNAVGWGHTVLGGLGTALGALATLVPVLMFLYGLYDFVYGLLFLMAGPAYIPHAIENLVTVTVISLILGVPALLMVGVFGVQLAAGVGLLRRKASARVAGIASCFPWMLLLGIPGIVLGVGAVMVLNDDDVKAELAA